MVWLKRIFKGNNIKKVWTLRDLVLPALIILAFAWYGYFRPSHSDQFNGPDRSQIIQEASIGFLHLNHTGNRPVSQTGSSGLTARNVIQARDKYPVRDIAAGIIIIILTSVFWRLVYRTQIRKTHAELDLKNKIISDMEEDREITLCEIGNMTSELNNAKAQATQSDKLKNAFISNMSHEIRTPMNAIVGLTSFLNDPKLSKAEADEYIETINSSCKQLLTVIDDIVDIAKIESGQMTITPEEINLNSLIRDLYLNYMNQGKIKNINLTYSAGLDDNSSQIFADRSRLRQVFCNLLNNAFRFTEKGNVEFGYFKADRTLTFYVKDDGVGIPPEKQLVIFNRFWQSESSASHSYGGLGLGLSISKRIVEKMGGNIWVESEPGRGSSFYFSLPFRDVYR